MTAIVALETEDGAWIGADSFYGSDQQVDLLAETTPKIFEVGPFLFAVSGSLRMGQILKYALAPLEAFESETPEAFMFRFANQISETLKIFEHRGLTSGQASLPNEGSCEILVLYKGKAYSLNGQFSFSRSRFGYHASGSGWSFALGSFASTLERDPEARVWLALSAASLHSPTVQSPFVIKFQQRS